MENADEADNRACEDEYAEGSIDEDTEREWSAKYLLIGIALPVIPWILMFLVSRWHYFLIRPWLATPLIYAIHASRVITAVVYYLWVRRRFGLCPLFQFGSPRKLLKELTLAALFTLALGLLYWIIETLLLPVLRIEIETPESWVQMGYGRNSVGLIVFLIYAFTIVPVAEEIYYRGFVYKTLKFRLPMVLALILQATFFAIAHRLDLPNTILIFLLGIVLAIGYELRKNLLTPVLMHCIINARHMIPWIVLMAINFHTPAANFSQAAEPPKWLDLSTFEDIERQAGGEEQRLYAINTWGSQGSRHWKREVKALEAVQHWFPEERIACLSARSVIIHIYNVYLSDYRRAIVHARRLLEEYPEYREQCAGALANIGWSYYMLRDFPKSREAYEKIIAEFKEFEYCVSNAHQGIHVLDELEN
jgi:hypothetical protein